MNLAALTRLLGEAEDEGEITALPYAATLGLRYRRADAGFIIAMPYKADLNGAPGRLHGGTVAGLLEIASLAQLIHALGSATAAPAIKPITVTIDYLRAAQYEETLAAAIVTRMGRRIANVRAEAWQKERSAPVATAHMNVMLDRR
jgi:uncharacterized protein (TIGR00369 family)